MVCSAASARSAIVNALALSTRISTAHAGLAKPMPSAMSKLQTAVVVKGRKRMEPSIRLRCCRGDFCLLEAAAICSRPLLLDVLCYPPHCGFCREEIAGTIDGNPLAHGFIGRIGFVRRHENSCPPRLQAPNPNALEPAWMPLRIRFRVCRINCVVPVYRQPSEILPFLGQDL